MASLIAILLAAILIFLGIKLLTLPIRWGFKLLLNAAAGFVLLVLFNFIGSWFGLAVTVNWLSAIVSGILGIPGIVLLLVVGLFL